jgi:hypothetical protein
MGKLNVTETQLSTKQLGMILADIGFSAQTIKQFASQLINSEDEQHNEAMRQSIGSLAERIGLLAGKAADEYPGTGGSYTGSTVEEWMMPAAY